MPDDRVTLLHWRDARTDPPRSGARRITDMGWAQYWDDGGDPGWYHDNDGEYLEEQPVVWCAPTPPVEDALTLDDLRRVVNYADGTDRSSHDAAQTAAARLRAALDAASAETEDS